jgi:hypothetical protein
MKHLKEPTRTRLEASSEMGLPLKIFPHKLPFDYSEIMERLIVWPGDEE